MAIPLFLHPNSPLRFAISWCHQPQEILAPEPWGPTDTIPYVPRPRLLHGKHWLPTLETPTALDLGFSLLCAVYPITTSGLFTLCCCVVAISCPSRCNPTDCSPPGSSVHGILRQEYWGGLPFPSPGDLSDPGIIEPRSPAWQEGFFTAEPPSKCCSLSAAAAKSLQSCLTLCDPIDGSPPGSAVPGILPGLPFPSPMHESEK